MLDVEQNEVYDDLSDPIQSSCDGGLFSEASCAGYPHNVDKVVVVEGRLVDDTSFSYLSLSENETLYESFFPIILTLRLPQGLSTSRMPEMNISATCPAQDH